MRKLILLVLVMVNLSVYSERPWQKFLTNKTVKYTIPKLKSVVLKNNIQLRYYENKLIPQARIKLIMNAGSYQESFSAAQMKLWGEMIVFSGSHKNPRKKLNEKLEFHSSDFSFHSALERSSFSINSLAQYLNQDLKLIVEVFQNPRFAKDDLQLLKRKWVSSINRANENPSKVAVKLRNSVFWKGHPQGKILQASDLEKVTVSQLRKVHKYILSQLKLEIVVTGYFDLNKVKNILNNDLIDENTSRYENKTNQNLKNYKLRQDLHSRLTYFDRKIPQTTMYWSGAGIKHSHPDYLALKLVNFILGGDSFNSYLMQKIRVEKGWAYGAYSFYSSDRYNGSVNIFVQSQNKNIPQVLSMVNNILNNSKNYLSQEKVAKAKKSLINKFVFLYENSHQLADRILSVNWDNLTVKYLNEYIEKLKLVSFADVVRVANKYYRPENFALFCVGPKKVFQSIDLSQESFIWTKLVEKSGFIK